MPTAMLYDGMARRTAKHKLQLTGVVIRVYSDVQHVFQSILICNDTGVDTLVVTTK